MQPPQALLQIADDSEQGHNPEVTNTVGRNFNVDDILKSVTTEEKAVWLVDQLTELLKGGFQLTKVASTKRKLLVALPEDERRTLL